MSSGIEYFSPADGLPGISAKFGPNHRLECNVWLYSTVFTESASVSLFSCPADFDPAVSTDPDRKATCTPGSGSDVTFAVNGETVATERTNAVGRITSPVAPGLNRISVDPGPDLVTGFVICDQTRTDFNQIQTIEVPINSDGTSISIELDANDKLACDWFLVAGTPSATADGVPGGDTTDGTAGGDTTDDTTDGAVGEGSSDTTSGDEGDESFGGGSEASDDETEQSDQSNDDGASSEPGEGADQTDDIGTGAEISNLTIQKWICEDVTVAGASYDDLTLACGPTLEPSSWRLNEIPIDSKTGQVIWESPGTGSLVVSLETSAGDSDSAVFCTVEPIGAAALEQQLFPVVNGDIVIEVMAPSEVYCNWFVRE